jgi:FtsP/CotA-like multicopper oxidase with cupredoxin domain
MSFVSTRRRFVQGVTSGALLWAAAPWTPARAASQPAVLSGTEFDLSIDALAVNYTGAQRTATAVNGQLPAPLLRWREGDSVTIRVTNRMSVPSSIHWHGVLVPAEMDGVPGLSFPGIAPGETYVYRFRVKQFGTYWYHAHTRFQEQSGLYGPIVIEPRGGQGARADRDYTVLLSDWSDSDPEHLFVTLKRQSEYFRSHARLGALGRNAHGSDRPDGYFGCHLHLSDERGDARAQLDSVVQRRG